MANYKSLALKLQTALCLAGEHIAIDEKRFYSIRYKRMLTKYILRRQVPGQPKETIAESYSVIEIVKRLAELYAATGGEKDGP